MRSQRGTPCIHSCTRHRLCWYPDGKHGPIGAQRPLTQVSWQVWAYWHAAATDSQRLALSEYSLARLRADMTISLHLSSALGTRNLCCLHFSVSKYSIAQNNSWALHCFMASPIWPFKLWSGVPLTRAQASLMGRFLLHVPYATFGGNVSLTRPVLASPMSYVHASSN